MGGRGGGGLVVVSFPIAPVVDFEDFGGCVCSDVTVVSLVLSAFRGESTLC